MALKKRNRVAFCYDFDKTLIPENMHDQGFIQDLGYSKNQFWNEVESFRASNDTDDVIAYMNKMSTLYTEKCGTLTYDTLKSYGRELKYFEGIDSWFEKINEVAKNTGVEIEHYIISSGNKEIIEGTTISRYFERIYASSFLYDDTGQAIWPARIVNYTNKTQYLFRISKGVLDELDDSVNAKVKLNDYSIPFKNMLYIGDSKTDIPSMKILRDYGGFVIGVYNPKTLDLLPVQNLMEEGRIDAFFAADYREGSPLFSACVDFINNIAERDN